MINSHLKVSVVFERSSNTDNDANSKQTARSDEPGLCLDSQTFLEASVCIAGIPGILERRGLIFIKA